MRTQIILASTLFILSNSGAIAKKAAAKSVATPTSFSGHWEKKKDPFCQMTLEQKGNKVTGEYSTSPYADGKKVQDGDITGTIMKPGHVRVTYTSGFANEGSKGKADLDLTSRGLKWTLVTSPTQDYGEDYSPTSVVMTKK
ncbi:MAG: hypothetical protein JST89_03975 [Cyanobacteria bacterium SZAS-4]|nr:hypothetical protein [Cyanobacteria bacterium SZAS-4]